MTTHPTDPDDFWGPPIHVYTRAQAIADGVLVDVSEAALEVGIRHPVAMTAAAFADFVTWDSDNPWPQDERGRLHDVVWMTRCAALRAPHGVSRIPVELLRVPNRRDARAAVLATVWAHVGPGDDGEPVMTLMLGGED